MRRIYLPAAGAVLFGTILVTVGVVANMGSSQTAPTQTTGPAIPPNLSIEEIGHEQLLALLKNSPDDVPWRNIAERLLVVAKNVPDDISWEDLARYPDRYEGAWIVFNGYVTDLRYDGDDIIVVNSDFGTGSYYVPNGIYVTNAVGLVDGGRILDGDTVSVYGTPIGVIHNDRPVVSAWIIFPANTYTMDDLLMELERKRQQP